MRDMQLQIDKILTFLRGSYPEFQDFEHAKFVIEEIEYKESASNLAHELLARDVLDEYIVDGDTNKFIKALEKVARNTNLLYLGAPRTGDLSILYAENLDKSVLCNVIFELLHGQGSVDDRLAAYLNFVDENQVPFKWTFPTYYLFLYYPDTEIFLKPSITRWFLKFVDSEVVYSNQTDIRI